MRNVKHLIALLAVAAASTSCGPRLGRSPVYLVVDLLEGASGNPVSSDVMTNGTFVADNARATLRAELKDPTNLNPTPMNDVTVSQYHVRYRRSDGRNMEGIDVPFAFDGASTATVQVLGSTTLSFELVRAVAKTESPLAGLAGSFTTIAEVTFYGRDQAGSAVTVSGQIQVDFANFQDSN